MNISDGDTYTWETDDPHSDNSQTMSDFIDNHLPSNFKHSLVDGTYAEIHDSRGLYFQVDASGNGDFTHHKVEFKELGFRL